MQRCTPSASIPPNSSSPYPHITTTPQPTEDNSIPSPNYNLNTIKIFLLIAHNRRYLNYFLIYKIELVMMTAFLTISPNDSPVHNTWQSTKLYPPIPPPMKRHPINICQQ